MKDKIVTLNDGKTKCKILDKLLDNGTTYYLVINLETGRIYPIKPNTISSLEN